MTNLSETTLNPAKWRWDLVGLFCLALFTRAAMLWTAVGFSGLGSFFSATPDTVNYMRAARALLAHSDSAENILFMFGPGFPAYLSALLRVFGESPLPILLAQIILSSVTCLLVYRLCRQILEDYTVSIVAGMIAALSLTSVSLSCVILSDTLYLLLFLLSLVLYFDALRRGSWIRFITSGLLLGIAVLTRTIGQFWPIPLLIITALLLRSNSVDGRLSASEKRKRMVQAIICVSISLAIMFSWAARNYRVHGIPTLAMTSAGGPANVAALTLEAQTGVPYREIGDTWYKEKVAEEGRSALSLAEHYHLMRSKTLEVMRKSPIQMFSVYTKVVWENLKAREELHLGILPPHVHPWANYLNTANRPFIFAVFGFLALLVLRRFRPAAILGLIYLYYASMIGFTKWQGSRLFYPGLAAEAVLGAVALVFGVRAIASLVRSADRRWDLGRRLNAWFDEPRVRGRRYALTTVLCLAGALVWLFWDFIFSDQMLKSVDVLGLGLPHHRMMLELFLRTWQFPGWNPYDYGGVPVIESISGAVFYPPELIDYLGYVPRMIGFNFLIHFLASGLFMYLAARQLVLSPPAALVAGMAYAFSPLILSWVAPGHDGKIFAATLFPLMVLFLDRVLCDARLKDAIGFGVIFALIVVTPHLQMALYAVVFAAGYAFWRCAARSVSTRSTAGVPLRSSLVTVGIVTGLGLSAVQWLPSAHYIPNESPRAYEGKNVDYSSAFSLHPEEVASLALPEFCGLDEINGQSTYWGRNGFKDNSESFGAAVVILALVGLAIPGNRRKFWWLAVAGAVTIYALGKHTSLFVFLVSHFGLLGKMRSPSTAMFVALFAGAVLAGMGVESIQQAFSNGSRMRNRLNRGLLIAIGALFLLCIMMVLKGRGFLGYYAEFFYPQLADASPRSVQMKEAALNNLPFLQQGLWRFLVVLVGIYLLVQLFARTKRMFLLSLGLAALVIFSASGIVSRCIKLIDPAVYWEPKPVTTYLRDHAGIERAVGFALNHASYLIGSYPIQGTIGLSCRPVMWYYRLSGEDPARNMLHARFANLAGTRYIVFPNQPQDVLNVDTLGPIPLDTVAVFPDCLVFENKNAFPRAFLVDSFRVMDSLWPAMVETANGTTDLRKVALLEQAPEIPIQRSPDSVGSARIDYYGADSITVAVSCRTNQILILGDTYYPAWHAYIDGRPAQTLRVDGAFRAVAIPAGDHRVEFVYSSSYVRAGGAISLTTLAGIGICFIGAVVVRRRRRAKG